MNSIDKTRQKRAHFVGGRLYTLQRAVAPNDGHAGATQVIDAAVKQDPFKIVDSSGKVLERNPGTARHIFRTWLRWEGGRWVIVDWKQDKH